MASSTSSLETVSAKRNLANAVDNRNVANKFRAEVNVLSFEFRAALRSSM